jgi:hypothetical protein
MKKNQFDIRECKAITGTLKSVAANYPKKSAEYKAIELAGKALAFACGYTVFKEFEKYLNDFGKKISREQILRLKEMGAIEAAQNGEMLLKIRLPKEWGRF